MYLFYNSWCKNLFLIIIKKNIICLYTHVLFTYSHLYILNTLLNNIIVKNIFFQYT